MDRRTTLSQRDIAGILRVDTKTLYNWRKNKPELYEIVMLGFRFKEMLEIQKSHLQELERIDTEFSKKYATFNLKHKKSQEIKYH